MISPITKIAEIALRRKRRGIRYCAVEFPLGVKIVVFADDITLEVYGESIEEVEFTTAHSIKAVEAFTLELLKYAYGGS